MFELFDEWRTRGHRQTMDDAATAVGPIHDESPEATSEPHAAIEAFGACAACGGPRFLHTEPVAARTARLALVCDGCGNRTEI